MVVVGPAAAAVLILQHRRVQAGLPAIVASIAGMVVYLLYNFLRFGDPKEFGGASSLHAANYLPPTSVETLGRLLVSPGRGLVWYSPIAVLGIIFLIRSRRHPVAQLSGAVTLGIVVGYVIQPTGGWDWGDRYLAPTLPLICAPLALLRGRMLAPVAVLIALGFCVQAPTLVSMYERAYAERPGQDNPGRHPWSVASSPIVRAWPAMVHQLRDAGRTDPRAVVAEAGSTMPTSVVSKQQLLTVVALWWWLLPAVGISQWLGLAVASAMVVGGIAVLVSACRTAGAERDGLGGRH
jgi:hypothetical protein